MSLPVFALQKDAPNMNAHIQTWLKQYPAVKVIWPFAVVFVLLIGMNSMYGKKKEPPATGIEAVVKRVEDCVQPIGGRIQQAGEMAGQVLDAGMRTINKGIKGFEKEPEENP